MADLTQIHKHHIVPKYRCEELGIDPDFDGNTIDTTRKQHALIHWGYHCNDLSPLLEVCNPPQYILDMIPLGDLRDLWPAQILALGEIDEIDISGENNPNYKHGRRIGGAYDPIYMKQYNEIYRNRPEYKEERKVYDKKYRDKPGNKSAQKAYQKEYRDNPENKSAQKAYQKEYRNRPEYKEQRKEWDKKYRDNPENKSAQKAYQKEYRDKPGNKEKINAKARECYDPVKRKEMYERKKLERATATLDNFM